MQKTILITGSTDGIGLATAQQLIKQGERVIVHGRSNQKVTAAITRLQQFSSEYKIDGVVADLSSLSAVRAMARELRTRFAKIDVLINNAGVFTAKSATTEDGLELRFVVNSIAPYVLTRWLLPLLPSEGRIVNLSSAAQSNVDVDALQHGGLMDDHEAYAQSKLALTMWTISLAEQLKQHGGQNVVVAVNPKSFLGSKMVKTAYNRTGFDLSIGADIISRAATSDQFKAASGKYFDNDYGKFADPHADALNPEIRGRVVAAIAKIAEPYLE